MTHWYLSLKRMLRPGTVLMLLLVLLTVWLGGMAGRQAELRPCGVVCEDPTELALEMQESLRQKGFPVYATREELTHDVSRGTLDCGAVLLPGLGDALAEGKPAGHVLFLTAPDSFLTEVYEAHLSAALYSASAPALTVQSAADAGVTLTTEEVRAELDALRDAGYSFTFDILTTEGVPPVLPDTGLAVSRAAAALLLFAAIVTGTIRAVEDADALWKRIGRKAALGRILLPSLFWQALLYTLAAGVTLRGDLAALTGYALLLTALGLIVARLPVKPGALLPICLLGALAMFPIYYDLTEYLPQTAVLHWVLPPCWLLKLLDCPAAGVLGLLAPIILLCYPGRRTA